MSNEGVMSNSTVIASLPQETDDDLSLLWLPYVFVTLTLSGMAFSSFFYYHSKNKGKYFYTRDGQIKATNKYRVTMNRNGQVASFHFNIFDYTKPPYKDVCIEYRRVTSQTNGGKTGANDAAQHQQYLSTKRTSSTVCNNYKPISSSDSRVNSYPENEKNYHVIENKSNESFDSNCDSDRSLLSSGNLHIMHSNKPGDHKLTCTYYNASFEHNQSDPANERNSSQLLHSRPQGYADILRKPQNKQKSRSYARQVRKDIMSCEPIESIHSVSAQVSMQPDLLYATPAHSLPADTEIYNGNRQIPDHSRKDKEKNKLTNGYTLPSDLLYIQL